jgi:hypothetical protein
LFDSPATTPKNEALSQVAKTARDLKLTLAKKKKKHLGFTIDYGNNDVLILLDVVAGVVIELYRY